MHKEIKRHAAKELRENKYIIIRRRDKSSIYVIMNRNEYDDKLDTILNDESKLLKLTSDPTETVKKRIAHLNGSANLAQKDIKFPKVEGDYSPGYSMEQSKPIRIINSEG